jgi:hypothetical protein
MCHPEAQRRHHPHGPEEILAALPRPEDPMGIPSPASLSHCPFVPLPLGAEQKRGQILISSLISADFHETRQAC